jgi:hypothetical protein
LRLGCGRCGGDDKYRQYFVTFAVRGRFEMRVNRAKGLLVLRFRFCDISGARRQFRIRFGSLLAPIVICSQSDMARANRKALRIRKKLARILIFVKDLSFFMAALGFASGGWGAARMPGQARP